MLRKSPSSNGQVATERYRVGDLEVDVQARRVVRDGEEVHVTELSFDVLVVLLRRAPGIVSKKALMREVWPGIVVEPDTVKKRIALLRSSLHNDDSTEPLIRVVRGRGYGINANVERLEVASPQARSPRSRRFTVVLTASALVMAVLAVGLALRPAGDARRQPPEARPAAALEISIAGDQRRAGITYPDTEEIDPVAYQHYLTGKTLRRTGGDLLAATEALERAIDIEPRFAAAFAELALCRMGDPYKPETERLAGLKNSRELAQTALKLDPALPEAIAAAAAVAMFWDWDWTEADALLERGLAASPGNEYLQSYRSNLSGIHGDLDESIQLLNSALGQDVTNARLHYSLGQRYYQAGRFREAIEAYRRALSVNPQINFAHLGIGRIRALQGDHTAALRDMALEPNPIFRIYGLVIAHTAAGNDAAAIAALEDFEKESRKCCEYWLGALNAYRGETNAAFRYLESAWKGREVGLLDLQVDPLLEGIRSDPRYSALVTRVFPD